MLMKMGTLPCQRLDALTYEHANLHCEMIFDDFDSCDKGSPSDEIWNKFEWTPPQSPTPPEPCNLAAAYRSSQDADDDVSLWCHNFANDAQHLPEIKDISFELLEQDQKVPDCSNKIRKDCMWNGRTDDLRTSQIPPRQRSNSPAFLSCSPMANGFVDPTIVFNFNQPNDRIPNLSRSSRRLQVAGLDTPSDSEEEVDVVTVEKKSPMKQTSSISLLANASKLRDTSAKSQQPLLAKSSSTSQNNSSRTLSVLIASSDHVKGKKTFQLKCYPIINSNPTTAQTNKRKLPLTEKKQQTVLQLMKLTNDSPISSPVMTNTELFPAPAEKRRLLSLDGISMVSDTGIKRHCVKKSEVGFDRKEDFGIIDEQRVNKEKKSSALLAEMKKPKKCAKKLASPPSMDSPTSSPGSASSEESLTWSKKRSPSRSRTSATSSSGSEEDSTRVAHNVLERQRRQGLRDLYNRLRKVVPGIADTEKAAKVNILTEAKAHIYQLQSTSESLQNEKASQQRKKQLLGLRLQRLAKEITSIGSIHAC